MKIYLLKDIEKVGFAGEILKVKDGYAKNFLLPRGLGVEVTPANEAVLSKHITEVENRKKALESKTSMLAEKIGNLKFTLKRKMHDDGKLYGALSPQEIVDLLTNEGIKISKSQVIFDKSIKERGSYEVVIKLSNNLKPTLNIKIVAE
ncbi:TPA: 50S ribosomal protein L9 [Candidatus Dependentiae bacterium]|nr:MAG: 50S ribosomal protein L9 [candidate division TM6 bacterium GW2011_GWF2_36_131]KKQ03207.1 MAG: 50S ribosomal protein L9 [candidate division TM6 bacterium GW2011_GWE2_36_25]KKQ19007.1 MAG: 50S ribosomal protein L9 [candidate division TM6 bacterium GW2011_GWA2_36_9]HBR70363.1 50S ribosomal protein L9 [Candidatus Dependentiae bacterium]HCU00908.1 50S ribosomal protein L9 [Candidatus Dependentiae bacterium]